ncbi:MAG TPA: hypothetical protein VNV41_03830 [Candidatus Acidoferrales bacterium]|nr:hypothetical protein [Candidatus Acidoferrales bacterium]
MMVVTWGAGLTRRLAFGVAVIAALAFLAAAQDSRAQTQAPAQQAPSSSPSTAPDASQVPAAPTHGQHTVTITFDYDFGRTPGCSKKVKTLCVQRFVAYDISAGAKQATMLFPIPLPPNPVGIVRGITATSPKLDFESGKHLLSVTAEGPDGRQSRKSVCTTWVTIP